MKMYGYFIECKECGSYEIDKSEPITNNKTEKTYQTYTCRDCKHEAKIEIGTNEIKDILIQNFHNKCEDCLLNGLCHLGKYEEDPKPCMQD